MAATAQQIRDYRGPALLSYGFRPFFLLGSIWAAFAVAIWLPFLAGGIALPTAMPPVQWHAHELIFGYVPAIVAGFLLTAVPNWTGRLPVTGPPLPRPLHGLDRGSRRDPHFGGDRSAIGSGD